MPGDQIDVDLIEVERVDPGHDLVDFLADVGAAVVAQNLVVEVFYSEAEASDADGADGF